MNFLIVLIRWGLWLLCGKLSNFSVTQCVCIKNCQTVAPISTKSFRLLHLLHQELSDCCIKICQSVTPVSSKSFRLLHLLHEILSDCFTYCIKNCQTVLPKTVRLLHIFHQKLSNCCTCFTKNCQMVTSKSVRLLHLLHEILLDCCSCWIKNCQTVSPVASVFAKQVSNCCTCFTKNCQIFEPVASKTVRLFHQKLSDCCIPTGLTIRQVQHRHTGMTSSRETGLCIDALIQILCIHEIQITDYSWYKREITFGEKRNKGLVFMEYSSGMETAQTIEVKTLRALGTRYNGFYVVDA